MPRINELIESLGVSRDEFAVVYEEVVGSPLKPRTSVVSDKNYGLIQEKFKGKKGSETKKTSKKSPKVIKSAEFQDKTGFLSGLGFSSTNEETEDQEETTSVATKNDFDIIKEQLDTNTSKNTDSSKKRDTRKGGFAPKPSYNFNVKKKVPETFAVKDSNDNKGYTTNKDYSKKNKKRQHNNYKNTESEKKNIVIKREPKVSTTSSTLIKKQEVFLEDSITVKEFSEKLGIELTNIMKVLLKNKIMVGINSLLDFDTAVLIGEELGVKIKHKEMKLGVESFLSGDLQAILDLDKGMDNLQERPPIVTVMGHVDHGKTTLLDYLRKTTFASGEAGGITQTIGASVVDYDGKRIAFIDTPGHELFTSLRARGAKLTNIAVIVIAADDSVMPQTIESINHAKAAGVPIVVAVTKIDKPGVNMEKIKTDIAKYGLTPEDWGGDTPIVGVSGVTGQGIPDLLEAILLQSEMLELKFNPKRSAVGVVLDAHKDPKQGIVTSIILMTGTLNIRDVAVAYNTYGKIKKIWDWKGKEIARATGGNPVQVLGFTELPEPGRIVEIVSNEKEAMNKVALIQAQQENAETSTTLQSFLNQLNSNDTDVSVLNLLLKAEGSSSLEALKQAVDGVELPKNVSIKVIHADVGPFTDSDLSLAQASKAILLGFNTSITNNLKRKSQSIGVDVKSFDIIYELTDYLAQLVQGMIKYEEEEVVIAKLEVLGIFYTKGKEMVIGGKVLDGKLRKSKFRVFRGEEVFAVGEIESLHKNKDEVKEVSEGDECGLKVKVSKKIELGDILEFYEMQEIRD